MTTVPGGMPAPAPAAARLPLSEHIRRSLRLAVPVMLGRAGLVVMITVDTMMTGRSGAAELAHYAISLAPHMTLLVIGIGLLVGTIVMAAHADGAGQPEQVGAIWRSALWIAGLLGVASGLALLWGEGLLRLLGQSPVMAAGGGAALRMFAPGMPAVLMYIATTFALEGINKPTPGMVVALSANLLNGLLNWVLIYGNLGAPEMGAAGAALATTITRWAMLAVLVGYTLTMRDRATFGIGRRGDGLATARRLIRIGAPLCVAAALETACFSTVAVFAGRLGELALAGYQVAFNVVTLVFMLSIGLSTATSVRVANAVGRNDPHGIAAAGWTGMGLVGSMLVVVAILVSAFNLEIARLYSTEAAVLALATPALAIAALVVMVDGTQAVALGALRGAGDVLFPTGTYAVSFWLISVPAAYAFGLKGEAGIFGLLWALFAGLACAMVLLGGRFALVSRHVPRRI